MSINDCHGQGPVGREHLEGQLGCAFLIIAQAVRGTRYGCEFTITSEQGLTRAVGGASAGNSVIRV